MTQTIRMTRYPNDPTIVALKTDYGLNETMRRFSPAQYSSESKAYLMHEDHIDALRSFARFEKLHVIDERPRDHSSIIRTLPHECRHCAQPGSMLNPPTRCVSCGAPWEPITPADIEHNEPISTTKCVGCGHDNTGRFMFCARCGQRMNHKPRTFDRPRFATQERETLSEPVRVSTALVEYAREHGGRPIMPSPVRPNTRQVIHQRPVVDVHLPEPPPDATDEPGASGGSDVLFEPENDAPRDPPPPSAQETPTQEETPWYAQPARSSDDEDEENWWNKG